MRKNNIGEKADIKTENHQVNPCRTVKENSKSYEKSSNMVNISEYQNIGLPSKTVEPAPGYQFSS